MNQGRAETLRRRIEVYRRCLRGCDEAVLVSVYRNEIAKAELELIELEPAETDLDPK